MMKMLNTMVNLFSFISMLTTTIGMLMVGFVGESIQFAFEKVKLYQLPRLSIDTLLRCFKGYSKPAYY